MRQDTNRPRPFGMPARINRRAFLGATATAAPAAALAASTEAEASVEHHRFDLEEVTIAELQRLMERGRLSSKEIVRAYIRRIERVDFHGPKLRSVLEINPTAVRDAERLDRERRRQGPRGPLHGIPILLKDNIDTADHMETTAGSLALLGNRPRRDATLAARLREAGAVLLGKTNLSEWANFRSFHSSSGWSARGGQNANPYKLDRSPCGSSSGSGAAPSANLTAAALGTETDGSILCPSALNSIVGIKPTVGLTSRAGVIPISHSQDTVGPMCRTVADAAAVLGPLTGVDPRDPATRDSAGNFHSDYTQFLDPRGLRGARIGVARDVYFGYSDEADAVVEEAIGVLRDEGATVVDPANIPTAQQMANSPAEFTVLLFEFKADLNAYLAERDHPRMRTLADLIEFNRRNADREMPFFLQEIFELSQTFGPLTDPEYLEALETSHRLSRQEGIDAVLAEHNLDAVVMPVASPPWKIDLVNGDLFLGAGTQPAAMAGYPAITVPAGFSFDVPVGMMFTGTAWSEPTLIRLAHGFEQATRHRRVPRFRRPAVGL